MNRSNGALRRRSVAGPLGVWILVAIAATVMTIPSTGEAVKANPRVFTRYQPDGTAVAVRMIGDERLVLHETADGYTILRRGDGWWVYADPASAGQAALRPAGLRAGVDRVPDGWARHVRPAVDPAAFRIPFDVERDGSIAERFLANGFGTCPTARPAPASAAATTVAATTLDVPVLVILVEFADWAHTSSPGTPLPDEPDYQPIAGRPNASETWRDLFNDPTVSGGLNHYFAEVSYGQMQWRVEVARNGLGSGEVVNDGWYVNPETMAYWGTDKLQGTYCSSDMENDQIFDLVVWAIGAADPDVDYARYDVDGDGEISDAELMVFVIHSRPGQEYFGDDCWGGDPQHHIWSHQWVLHKQVRTDDGVTFPGRHSYSLNPEFEPAFDTRTEPWSVVDKWFAVGVYAHEAFHTLGAPDLYDYGYDANVAGEWDLMDNGSYNGSPASTRPSHMGTPLKLDIELQGTDSSYGWISPEEVTDLTDGAVHAEGGYRIDALGGGSHANVMHRMVAPSDPGEWFVLENRAPVGTYEPYLPEFGILVWHRDLDGSRDSWPYRAAVERRGWASSTTGLITATAGAALSLDDGETELTSASDPDNALNDDTPSGLLDVRCVGAETASMPYVYGSLSGPDVDYAGATVDDRRGDDDGFLDNGETVKLAVGVRSSDCATEPAEDVELALVVDPASDIPASAVSIRPASARLGDLAPGRTLERRFAVTLACDPAGYRDRSVTFRYTLTGANFDLVSGTFVTVTDRDYLFTDDMESDEMGALWSGTVERDVSACVDAAGHGEWSWTSKRAHSGSHSYHTPEESEGVSFANPEESLVGPTIEVPAGVGLKELSFWHAADIPCPGSTRARLWVSTDGGATWSRNESFYKDGGDLEWEQTRVNLTGLVGATSLRFKLVMYTYECWTDCVGTEGWYVDDVRVLSDELDSCGE